MRRLLVVDDDPLALRSYDRALSKLHHGEAGGTAIALEIVMADGVALALQKLQEQSFDVLVVDLKIPSSSGREMGGLEVVDEWLRVNPGRPIIVMSGYGARQLGNENLPAQVYAFIEKSDRAVEELGKAAMAALASLSDQ